MRSPFRAIDGFFFARVSASGFGLMRVFWGVTAFLWMFWQWADITEFYSNAGVMPPAMESLFLRDEYRFSILHWFPSPEGVLAIYLLMLACFVTMTLGIAPRVSTILSVILLTSFHERNPLPLGGGDTVLRLLGILLMVAPTLDAFSFKRLRAQWKSWYGTGAFLPPLTMAIWPWRLLLWQFVILYGTSVWYKSMGSMWANGTAIAAALHHPVFARLPMALVDVLTPLTPLVTFAAMAWQFAWIVLLIPRPVLDGLVSYHRVKRWLIFGGILFHGSILALMDAGSFSPAILAGYAGLLVEEDFQALRVLINRRWRGTIRVLYDGRCAFCRKSVFVLQLLDHLKRLQFVNFHDTATRKVVAPQIPLENLREALHIVMPVRSPIRGPRSKAPVYAGFDAFRELALHIPTFWLLAPLLYLPGAGFLGRKVYAWIARHRHGSRSRHVSSRA